MAHIYNIHVMVIPRAISTSITIAIGIHAYSKFYIIHIIHIYRYINISVLFKIPVGFFLGTRHVRTFWES